jgi:hypothetical protein
MIRKVRDDPGAARKLLARHHCVRGAHRKNVKAYSTVLFETVDSKRFGRKNSTEASFFYLIRLFAD